MIEDDNRRKGRHSPPRKHDEADRDLRRLCAGEGEPPARLVALAERLADALSEAQAGALTGAPSADDRETDLPGSDEARPAAE